MKFIKGDYFKIKFKKKFVGIITDPPYKNAIKGKLNEQNFDILKFMKKSYDEIIDDGFLIIFSNFHMSIDLIINARLSGWKFCCEQIWDKRPTRTWISWSRPLRHCEYILYFSKGKFNFNFKTGKVKPKVNRSSFGGSLKETKKNTNKVSYEMYHQIIDFTNPRNKIHPTEKPIKFCNMFKHIVGGGDSNTILDPFCGTGNLIIHFKNSIGIDLKKWRNFNDLFH